MTNQTETQPQTENQTETPKPKSPMYPILRRLFLAGRLTQLGLRNSVKRGWLTQDEADQLVLELLEADTTAGA